VIKIREESKKWHNSVLSQHQALMFETLIHKHNMITDTPKAYIFQDQDGLELDTHLRGYLALKEMHGIKNKYFITEKNYSKLPIRINKTEELYYKEGARTKSVILRPTDVTPFNIKPQQTSWSNKTFIDNLAPFTHTQPLHWTLNKICAITSFTSKTFLGISSLSEFGKSSIYLILDAITQQCPVFQPRSVPGVLINITGTGNMIFDEVHEASSDVKNCMENFSLQVAGNTPVYINGAMKSKNTKPRYDVSQQSITYLYNIWTNYSEPEKQFWNNIWKNKLAMESRFLCLKFEGKLTEQFDKDFDIVGEAEKNKMAYIETAKQLLWMKQQRISNTYKRKYGQGYHQTLKGRHKIIYDELTWTIDQYSESQQEYNTLILELNKCITNYQSMIGNRTQSQPTEERIDDLSETDVLLMAIESNKEYAWEDLQQKMEWDITPHLRKLLEAGSVFESKPAHYRRLE